MSKLTKNERIDRLERQVTALTTLLKMKGYKEPEPKLKQLDQSVFDGLDEEWRWAAVNICTKKSMVYRVKPKCIHQMGMWFYHAGESKCVGDDYDASDWQNSLIERDKVELTGSDLCRAMLARGDSLVMCKVSDRDDAQAKKTGCATVILVFGEYGFEDSRHEYKYAVPINNQGEPIAAADVDL